MDYKGTEAVTHRNGHRKSKDRNRKMDMITELLTMNPSSVSQSESQAMLLQYFVFKLMLGFVSAEQLVLVP